MKVLPYLAAAMLALIPMPASATLFNVSIYGVVTGTRETWLCDPNHPSACQGPFSLIEPFSSTFTRDLFTVNLNEGANLFSVGIANGSGSYSGTILLSNGFLTGSNLSYRAQSCSNPCPIGAVFLMGEAATFGVVGGIPEPSTWAMMLMGFGGIGFAMRRRARAARLTVA